MTPSRSQLIALIEEGSIPDSELDHALKAANIPPDGRSWRSFIDHLLLWLGVLVLVFALMFFIAYNWSDIGRFAKFCPCSTTFRFTTTG